MAFASVSMTSRAVEAFWIESMGHGHVVSWGRDQLGWSHLGVHDGFSGARKVSCCRKKPSWLFSRHGESGASPDSPLANQSLA
jgi:hypothetical protein